MTENSRPGNHEGSGGDEHDGDRSGAPEDRGRGDRWSQSRPGHRRSKSHGGRRDDRRGGHRGRDGGGHRGRDDRRGGRRGRDDRRDFKGRRGDRRGGYRGRDDRREGHRGPREERRPVEAGPELPEEATYRQLDPEIKRDMDSLPKSLAEMLGKHIVAAGMLMDEDPEQAYAHAAYARGKASRVPGVRETFGLAAYTLGKWQEALADLRAARRMSGRDSFLAIMADCERGLGRPERALKITDDPAADKLDAAERIELRIVASGARRDMGDAKGALAELQVPELKERRARPWIARLFYAYADVLNELGREDEAREYFARASSVDREGVTDADERLAALEGVELVDVDTQDGIIWTDADEPDNDEVHTESEERD